MAGHAHAAAELEAPLNGARGMPHGHPEATALQQLHAAPSADDSQSTDLDVLADDTSDLDPFGEGFDDADAASAPTVTSDVCPAHVFVCPAHVLRPMSGTRLMPCALPCV